MYIIYHYIFIAYHCFRIITCLSLHSASVRITIFYGVYDVVFIIDTYTHAYVPVAHCTDVNKFCCLADDIVMYSVVVPSMIFSLFLAF